MYRFIFIFAATLLLSFSPSQAKSDVYGKGVHLRELTKISSLMDNPEKYIGKRIKVTGMVIEVCAKRGCWIYLASDRPFEKIQIKVTDGEIIFPMSASGNLATVEGIVDELNLSQEELIRYKKHQAEEKGLSFDPSTVKEGEKIIRIIGLGAEIES